MNTILLHINESIATITLNRPEKRNALNAELLTELRNLFTALSTDNAVRVIVLEGAGKAFCAGADLEYLQKISEYSIIDNFVDSRLLQETFHTIYTCPKPVIAKVHGPAIAGGCGLASVCDFVVASKEKALFGYSEVKIGFVAAIVMVYLLKKIGDTRTRNMLLTAENITALEAERIGLITHAVDADLLDDTVQRLAKTLIKNSASSLMITKEMLRNLHGMSLEDGLRYASAMNAFTRMTDDCKNGIASFLG